MSIENFKPKSSQRIGPTRTAKLGAAALGVALSLGGGATALAAAGSDADEVSVLNRKGQLERSLDVDEARQSYHRAFDEAERLDVEPDRNLAEGVAGAPELQANLVALTGKVARAKAEEKIEQEEKPEFGTPESVGVDQGTLDAIASCESGGDPTVVDASGTYHGKYQFDVGTWASVGGSGLPSAAPEAEQDYRAALLYSQAGSSPWPVCGS